MATPEEAETSLEEAKEICGSQRLAKTFWP